MALADDARIVSDDVAVSPLSGNRAAIVCVELEERDASGQLRSLGEMVFGDIVVLETTRGQRIEVVARRATILLLTPRPPSTPLTTAPAELLPLMRRARGGALFVREHLFRSGARVRVRVTDEGVTTLEESLLEEALRLR